MCVVETDLRETQLQPSGCWLQLSWRTTSTSARHGSSHWNTDVRLSPRSRCDESLSWDQTGETKDGLESLHAQRRKSTALHHVRPIHSCCNSQPDSCVLSLLLMSLHWLRKLRKVLHSLSSPPASAPPLCLYLEFRMDSATANMVCMGPGPSEGSESTRKSYRKFLEEGGLSIFTLW